MFHKSKCHTILAQSQHKAGHYNVICKILYILKGSSTELFSAAFQINVSHTLHMFVSVSTELLQSYYICALLKALHTHGEPIQVTKCFLVCLFFE